MPVANHSSSGALSSMISEEGTDSLDTIIKQAIGREHHLPFLRTGDSPVQWIQLLHGMEPDLPGWPFLRIEMQKCEKCPQQFCSPINYRRHLRVHRRTLNGTTESGVSRDILAAFWDKLSWEEAEDLLSFNGVMLKGVPGPKIIDALATSLRTAGIWSFPEAYVKAGSALLEIIQTRPSGLPKSYELFRILDTAAEGTFLCAGTAESVGKRLFEGETVNILELKNLVASTGFLFELQLVKAWFAEKDVEALRLQKILVEEEEAAQKRQADILEKKRQKKLRRKEHKVKEIFGDYEVSIVVDSLDAPVSAETSDLSSPPDLTSSSPDVPSNLDSLMESLKFEPEADIEAQLLHVSYEDTEIIESQITNEPRQLNTNHWQVPKSQRVGRGRFHTSQNPHTFKRELAHQQGPSRNWVQKKGSRVWTKKSKVDDGASILKPPALEEETHPQIQEVELKPPALEEKNTPQIEEAVLKPPALTEETTPQAEETELKPSALAEETTPQVEETELKPPAIELETTPQVEETEGEELMIGSIPIVLKSRASPNQEKNAVEKLTRADSLPPAAKRVASKQWRPVSRGENKSSMPVDRDTKVDSEGGADLDEAHGQILSAENCMLSESTNNDFGNPEEQSDGNVQEGSLPFCSATAKEFLARKWKEAVSADHVTLELSSPPEPGGSIQHDQSADSEALNTQKGSVVGNAEEEVGRKAKAKYRKNAEKEQQKVKYIPKHKA